MSKINCFWNVLDKDENFTLRRERLLDLQEFFPLEFGEKLSLTIVDGIYEDFYSVHEDYDGNLVFESDFPEEYKREIKMLVSSGKVFESYSEYLAKKEETKKSHQLESYANVTSIFDSLIEKEIRSRHTGFFLYFIGFIGCLTASLKSDITEVVWSVSFLLMFISGHVFSNIKEDHFKLKNIYVNQVEFEQKKKIEHKFSYFESQCKNTESYIFYYLGGCALVLILDWVL